MAPAPIGTAAAWAVLDSRPGCGAFSEAVLRDAPGRRDRSGDRPGRGRRRGHRRGDAQSRGREGSGEASHGSRSFRRGRDGRRLVSLRPGRRAAGRGDHPPPRDVALHSTWDRKSARPPRQGGAGGRVAFDEKRQHREMRPHRPKRRSLAVRHGNFSSILRVRVGGRPTRAWAGREARAILARLASRRRPRLGREGRPQPVRAGAMIAARARRRAWAGPPRRRPAASRSRTPATALAPRASAPSASRAPVVGRLDVVPLGRGVLLDGGSPNRGQSRPKTPVTEP